MRRGLESDSLVYTLGPSYMEDDTRAQTDKLGFCPEHWEKLYACQNRLGLSLIMHTHIKYLSRIMDKQTDVKKPLKHAGMFAKSADPSEPLYKSLNEAECGCFICARVNRILERYIDTMFYMWPRTPELLTLARKCGGFCLAHFVMILKIGPDTLKESDWLEFMNAVFPIQRQTLESLEADLDWFIRKYDYRNAGEPWGNSKDALPRAIKAIGGAL